MLDHEKLAPLLKNVADSVSRSFPSYIDPEDTLSALYVWAYENRKMINQIMADAESWERRLYHLITKAANTHVLKEDAAVNGYSEDDTFLYSADVVKELLSVVWDYEDWQSFGLNGEPGMPRSQKLVNQGGDWIAMLCDIKRALKALGDDQYNILVWVYKYHWTHENLAEELEISKEAASKRVSRAVGAVRKELGLKPLSDLQRGHSARSKVGTAEALAISERQYEG